MVQFELEGYLSPNLSLQAVDAPVLELVTQPRAVRFIGGITFRPMSSVALRIRVIEYQVDSPLVSICNNLR